MNKTVHVSVSNIYKKCSYQSEITSQAILGESVTVIEEENDFYLVRQQDSYEGWIKNNQVSNWSDSAAEVKMITSHIIQIFQEKNEYSDQIRDAVIGCKLNVIDSADEWFQVLLPDGMKGWVKKRHFGTFPILSRQNVINLAKQFIGYPYFWGGRSPRGFDCSGFVQTVFGLLGKMLPRDSFMQQKSAKYISKKIEDAQMGDLYFFGDDGVNVDHVGIALGNNKILHSRGMVRINSLNENDADFDKKLPATLISVSTVF